MARRFRWEALLFASASFAAEANVSPELVCDDRGAADKNLLAASILIDAKVSGLFNEWAAAAHPNWASNVASHIISLGDKLCEDAQMGKSLQELCKKQAPDLNRAQTEVNALTRNELPGFNAADAMRSQPPEVVFSASSPSIRCSVEKKPPDEPKNDTPFPPHNAVEWRVRGKADDLYIDRDEQPAGADAFSAVDKATLSFNQNDAKSKRVRAVSGLVGLAINVNDESAPKPGGWDHRTELVPYVGIHSSITKAARQDPDVKQNDRVAGVAFEGTAWSKDFGFGWSVRPQATWDLVKDSKLFTTALQWRPYKLQRLNSVMNPGSPFTLQFLLDFRLNHGSYSDRGLLTPEQARDYDRLGGQAGLMLSGGEDSSWTWTTKETWFYALSGNYRSLGQLTSVFSYTFDTKKLVGIDLKYTDGRDGITGEYQKEWEVALGFRY